MKLAVNIKVSLQSVHQAGHSPFKIVGETEAKFTREGKPQQFKGSWLTEKLDVEILAGIPFMEENKSTIRPALWQVTIGNSTVSRVLHSQPPHTMSVPADSENALKQDLTPRLPALLRYSVCGHITLHLNSFASI